MMASEWQPTLRPMNLEATIQVERIMNYSYYIHSYLLLYFTTEDEYVEDEVTLQRSGAAGTRG